MKNLKVTILMSVYNGEKYLRKAVDSILNQTFKDFEFLIINDGSTDKTAEILQSYRDPRIKIVNNQKNMGLTKSLSRGLGIAKGDYIARMDADDISMPERLEKQVNMLEQRPELGMVGTWYCVIDEKDNIKYEVKNDGNPVILRWKLLFNNEFVHSSVMMRKRAYEDSGGYNPEFQAAQDYDLWSRIAKKWQIGLVPKILCYRRERTEHSITIEKNKTQKAMARKVRVRSIDELTKLTNGRLPRKQCIDLYDLFNGYYVLDKVSQVEEILQSLKMVRECFEDIFSDKSIRCEINDQLIAALYGCISRASTFYQRVFLGIYVLWFGGWKSAHRMFLAFSGLFLPDSVRNGGKSFLKLLGWKKIR